MIDRFERFSAAISDITRCWHKLAAQEMEKYGLKGSYVMYLICMYHHPEGVTATQLAELTARDKSDVSRAMTSMEKQGLVSKDDSQGRYRALLRLTEKGISAARYIRRRACIGVHFAGQGIDVQRRDLFYETLECVAENLQRITQEGLPDTAPEN